MRNTEHTVVDFLGVASLEVDNYDVIEVFVSSGPPFLSGLQLQAILNFDEFERVIFKFFEVSLSSGVQFELPC